MKEHLTSNDILQCLIEGPAPDAQEHLRECGRCRTTLAEAQAPLSVFRWAVVAWSEAQSAKPVRESTRWAVLRERLNFMNWVPAFGVAAAIAVLAAFLVRTPAIPKAPAPAPVQISDGALIEQVDAEVSETVPDAMAPLTDLVAWDSGQAADEKSGGAKKAVKGKTNPAARNVAD
jgi:hypothetical protein